MTDISIMIEGQNGLTWPRWQRIARAVEDLGFAGLFRSDHYTNASPPDLDSLELWTSLTYLASHTSRIHFGPLVSPVSSRNPTQTARMAAAVDDLSGGRLVLGLGAGWQDREHHNFGLDLLDVPDRFARFEEALQVIEFLLRSDVPVDFSGHYYCLYEAILLPRPAHRGGPPILIGGNGVQRTLPLAAIYADEWNGVFTTPEHYAELNKTLDALLDAEGRQPQDIRRSIMVGTISGRDEKEVREKVKRTQGDQTSLEEARQNGAVVGTPGEIARQIQQYRQAGAQQIMLQWLGLDDLEGLERLATGILSS